MDLDNRYELFEVVANDSESKTFRAREIPSGREVLVHLMFGGIPAPHKEKLLDLVLQRLVDPLADKRRQILEISDYKGMPYAVTEPLPGFRSLREWLMAERQPEAAPAPAAASPPDPLAMTGKWAVPAAAPPPEAALGPPPPKLTPSPPQPAAPADDFDSLFGGPRPTPASTQAPGEFTRMMQAAPPLTAPPETPPAPPVAPPPAPAAVPQAPPSGSQPGDFTRLFGAAPVGAPVPAAPEPAWAPPQPASQPTWMAPPSPPQPASQPSWMPPSPPPQPPQPAPSGGGGFTRLFGPTSGTAVPPMATAAAPPAGGATQVFSGVPQAARAPAPPRAQGPGEYTAMFGAPAQPAYQPPAPPLVQPAVPPAAAQAPARAPLTARPYFIPVLIVGNVVFLLVAVLLIYLLVRR